MWATLSQKRILQYSNYCNIKSTFWLSQFVTAQIFGKCVHQSRNSMFVNGESGTGSNSHGAADIVKWYPEAVLSGGQNVGNGYACLVLNRSVEMSVPLSKQLWQNARINCLVDGGANHWRNFLQKHCKNLRMKQPEFITGDFDSITTETRQFFGDVVTKYIHTPDQDETDFTKALRTLKPHMEEQQLNDAIVLQENSGRLDHILANINTLFKLQTDIFNVYLLSSTCLTWLLLPGKHILFIPKDLVTNNKWCALMPVGSAAPNVTTAGLKWNLKHSPLEFGYMVSTSNTYALAEVYVETDKPLVWSMGINATKENGSVD